MKKSIYLIVLALVLGLVLTGCSLLSNVGQVPTNEQSGIINLTKGTSGTITLYAGQDISVGTVTVSNDDTNLYVTYNTTGGWVMTETHLAVATTLPGIPQTKKGNPIPGQFPYKHEDLGYVTSDPYEIPLVDLGVGADKTIYIAAHAKVIRPIEDCWETVWQIGDVETYDCNGSANLTNYANEFNWKKKDIGDSSYTLQVDDCEEGPKLGENTPVFTTPFIVGTTNTNEFPFNSNKTLDYATSIEVEWKEALPFGGRLTVSWSPGKSALETKVISGEGITNKSFSVTGKTDYGKGWFLNSWLLVENSVAVSPLTYGKHIINFNHTQGDGSYWDWIKLERPCVQKESAWAGSAVGEMPFSGANWATYFTYTVEPVLLETLSVNSALMEGSISVNVLDVGKHYNFKVIGTWTNRGWESVDAKYASPDNWTNHSDGPGSPGTWDPRLLDLQVNGSFVADWGAYSAVHIYYLDFTGIGSTVNFRVFDGEPTTNTLIPSWYNDNVGSLTVEIYWIP